MKMRLSKIFLSFSITLISMGVFGHTRMLQYADRQFNLENYAKAVGACRDTYSNAGNSTAVRLGEPYDKLGIYEESYDWWGRAVDFEESDMEDYAAFLRSAYFQAVSTKVLCTTFHSVRNYRNFSVKAYTAEYSFQLIIHTKPAMVLLYSNRI